MMTDSPERPSSPERPRTHDRSIPTPPKMVSVEDMKEFTREELELRALTDKIMTIAGKKSESKVEDDLDRHSL